MPQPRSIVNRAPLSDVADTAGAGPVTGYLIGNFEYYGDPKPALTLRKASLGFTVGLVSEIKRHNNDTLPERWRVGIDRERRLIEVRPDPQGLKLTVIERCCSYKMGHEQLAAWLISAGVPTGQPIEAHWQPQTGSVVGRYMSAVTDHKSSASSDPDPNSSVPRAHRWEPCTYTGPGGGKVYRCAVCGYHTSDPTNPLLVEKPCQPGRYDHLYEVKDGILRWTGGSDWVGGGKRPGADKGGGRRKTGESDEPTDVANGAEDAGER